MARSSAAPKRSNPDRTDFRLSREHEAVTLSARDRDRFLDLLDNPPAPSDALRRAARHHREIIRRSE